MGYIYKVVNTLNGHVYIGQTRRTPEIRWSEHIETKNKYDTAFSRALRKYPEDVFELGVIEEVPDSVLDEREEFWIERYNSYEDGYNSTRGGTSRHCVDYEEIRDLWRDGFSVGEISEIYGCGKSTIQHILRSEDDYTYEESYARGERRNCRDVMRYDLEGNFICLYSSISEAARDVGCDAPGITNACIGVNQTCGGYQWRYAGDEAPGPYHKRSCAMVDQYDLNGSYIRTYDSIRNASIYTGISSSGIGKACRELGRISGGYQWRYSEDEAPGPYVSRITKPVLRCTLEFKPLEYYNSIREAADMIDGDVSTICACCNGRKQTYRGYRWRYAE